LRDAAFDKQIGDELDEAVELTAAGRCSAAALISLSGSILLLFLLYPDRPKKAYRLGNPLLEILLR